MIATAENWRGHHPGPLRVAPDMMPIATLDVGVPPTRSSADPARRPLAATAAPAAAHRYLRHQVAVPGQIPGQRLQFAQRLGPVEGVQPLLQLRRGQPALLHRGLQHLRDRRPVVVGGPQLGRIERARVLGHSSDVVSAVQRAVDGRRPVAPRRQSDCGTAARSSATADDGGGEAGDLGVGALIEPDLPGQSVAAGHPAQHHPATGPRVGQVPAGGHRPAHPLVHHVGQPAAGGQVEHQLRLVHQDVDAVGRWPTTRVGITDSTRAVSRARATSSQPMPGRRVVRPPPRDRIGWPRAAVRPGKSARR